MYVEQRNANTNKQVMYYDISSISKLFPLMEKRQKTNKEREKERKKQRKTNEQTTIKIKLELSQ